MNARQNREWVICPTCKGEGTIDALGVVNPRDFSPEEWDEYMDGSYDRACGSCNSTGKVLASEFRAPIVRVGSDGQNVHYDDADDASEHALRMAEGWA